MPMLFTFDRSALISFCVSQVCGCRRLPNKNSGLRWTLRPVVWIGVLLLSAMAWCNVAQADDPEDCDQGDSLRNWAKYGVAIIQAQKGDIQGAKNTIATIGQKNGKTVGNVTSVWAVNGQSVYNHPPVEELSPAPGASMNDSYQLGYNYDGSIVLGFLLKNGQYDIDNSASVDSVDNDACEANEPADSPAPTASVEIPGKDNSQTQPVERQTPGWGGRDEQGNRYFLRCDRTPDHVPDKAPDGLPAEYLKDDPQHGPVVDFTDDVDGGVHLTSRKYADGHVKIESVRAK
jgi:hypothetical protein